jgi:hypothetical protein
MVLAAGPLAVPHTRAIACRSSLRAAARKLATAARALVAPPDAEAKGAPAGRTEDDGLAAAL